MKLNQQIEGGGLQSSINTLREKFNTVPRDLTPQESTLFQGLVNIADGLLDQLANLDSLTDEEVERLQGTLKVSINQGLSSTIPDYIYRSKFNLGTSPIVLKQYIELINNYLMIIINEFDFGYDFDRVTDLLSALHDNLEDLTKLNNEQVSDIFNLLEKIKPPLDELFEVKFGGILGDFFKNSLVNIANRLTKIKIQRRLF